jgi:hypothetical protein
MGIKKARHPKRRKLLKTLGKVGIFIGGVYTGKQITK